MAARRVTIPSKDDLFRPTAPSTSAAEPAAVADPEEPASPRKPSGRVKHDEKVTIYLSSEELLRISQTLLELRSTHGIKVDRGRLVREAVAALLEDHEAKGAHSELVARLSRPAAP